MYQKFQERKSAFEKGVFKDEQDKEKWAKVLSMEYMSSDESGEDEGKEVIIAHSLPWLSPNVQLFKKRLDEASFKEKSPQAKRMIKDRRVGNNSLRPKPGGTVPSWVFTE